MAYEAFVAVKGGAVGSWGIYGPASGDLCYEKSGSPLIAHNNIKNRYLEIAYSGGG